MANSTKTPETKVAISRKKLGGDVPMVVREITDRCLYTGFFGTLDSARMKLRRYSNERIQNKQRP